MDLRYIVELINEDMLGFVEKCPVSFIGRNVLAVVVES